MGRHLKTDRIMRRTTTGSWMLKRVSAEVEKRFPRKYREILRDRGAIGLTVVLKEENGWTLGQAWAEAKRMVNG